MMHPITSQVGPRPIVGRKPLDDIGNHRIAVRKLCVVVQHHLGKGTRCAFPLHPSGLGSCRGLTPFQSQRNVSPFHHSQGLETSLSTCTEPWISVTAREWELALVDHYDVAADGAIHALHRKGDQHNHHAYVLTTTRVRYGRAERPLLGPLSHTDQRRGNRGDAGSLHRDVGATENRARRLRPSARCRRDSCC